MTSLAHACQGGGEGTKEPQSFVSVSISQSHSPAAGQILSLPAILGRAPHPHGSPGNRGMVLMSKLLFLEAKEKVTIVYSHPRTPGSSDQDSRLYGYNDFHHHSWSRPRLLPQWSLKPGSWALKRESDAEGWGILWWYVTLGRAAFSTKPWR